MALQKQIKLMNGIELPNAYIKISTFDFYNKVNDSNYVKIEVSIFKDKDARNNGRPEVIKFIHKFSEPKFSEYFNINTLNQADTNFLKQSYSLLKTMDVYSGAIDIQDDKE